MGVILVLASKSTENALIGDAVTSAHTDTSRTTMVVILVLASKATENVQDGRETAEWLALMGTNKTSTAAKNVGARSIPMVTKQLADEYPDIHMYIQMDISVYMQVDGYLRALG